MKKIISLTLVSVFIASNLFAAESSPYRRKETMLFKDVYDQNAHSELVNQLDLSRWGRKIFRKPLRSKNVNVYDEVPDSSFFTNRHARSRMNKAALVKGFAENEGPDLSADLTIYKGKTDGLHPGYFVQDSRGDKYLIKFDASENLELETSAEIIGSRFYYALGYNVPQYTVALIEPEKLKVGENVKFRNKNGFLKTLTPEIMEEQILFLPQNVDGLFRASASKILNGERLGYMSLTSRRKADPDDIVNHRDRREIRALRIFSTWLNNNDVRESNTLDMYVTEGGKSFVKHYIYDFNSSLGGAHNGPKPPSFGHEYMYDYGEVTKAFWGLGFWEKAWQKRWNENGEKANTHDSAALGYFDNVRFDPKNHRTQLPYEVFKRVTRADGFWAAKQIMAFTDEDIRAIVAEGKLTEKKDEEYVAATLIQRRDLIAQYWFAQAAPLDNFEVKNGKLVFEDLAVKHGFTPARNYSAALVDSKGRKTADLGSVDREINLNSAWFSNGPATIELRTGADSPYVRVALTSDGVTSILHQD